MTNAKCIVFAMLLAFSASVTADEQPVLSLNGVGNSNAKSAVALYARGSRQPQAYNLYSIDFVPGSSAVAGVNFDVIFKGNEADIKISNCGDSVKSSHVARCEMVEPNRLRVLIFSAPVQELAASSLVTFEIAGSVRSAQIDQASVAVSNLNGDVISAEIL